MGKGTTNQHHTLAVPQLYINCDIPNNIKINTNENTAILKGLKSNNVIAINVIQ